jgi:outer membrane protein assembly factor BamA
MMKYAIAALLFASMCLPISMEGATLSEEKLAKKKEGWYPTGLPLLNFSSDDGFGYGGRAYIYYNGGKDDPYYQNTPYFMQLFAQYFATTNGKQSHKLSLDMPYVAGTRFRIKTEFIYEFNLNENYFGVGEETSHEKLTDNTGKEYRKADDLESAIEGTPYEKWNNYTLTRPGYSFYLFRDIGDELKLMAGYEIKSAMVETWAGRKFDGTRQQLTLLDVDRDALTDKAGGRLGGLVSMTRFGIAYDTRDFEPNPNKGYYIDYCAELSSGAIGSDFQFLKNNFQAMYFITLVRSLVLGARVGYTTAAGDIPFYEESFFGFALARKKGLGGSDTMLGYKKNRFVSKTMTLANVDLRWQFAEVMAGRQRFGFQLVGFADAGNAYDEAKDPVTSPDWGYYHLSYGGGIAIAWNLSTIVKVYYGMSEEDSNISIDFEHRF